jgi:photosystem II stability/assembly factor-like uncharacterized protein
MAALARFGQHRKRARPIFASRKRRSRRANADLAVIGSSVLVAGFALAVFIVVTIADQRVQAPAGDEPVDDPVHVHGLGVNPADNSLFIATHTGLFRVPDGEEVASRVSQSRQDTMGFTVVGPDRFLGSGHPDVREMRQRNLPPHLGLIESTDAGETWVPKSLLGEADFHGLDAAGTRVYGFDATNARLLVSRDKGARWTRHALPRGEPLIDLAVAPDDGRHIVATTETGLFESRNEGRSWTLRSRAIGLLEWPTSERLYLVSREGEVRASANGGATWRATGALRTEPAALLATDADELYVALHDGTVKRSTDGGASWVDRSAPSAA